MQLEQGPQDEAAGSPRGPQPSETAGDHGEPAACDDAAASHRGDREDEERQSNEDEDGEDDESEAETPEELDAMAAAIRGIIMLLGDVLEDHRARQSTQERDQRMTHRREQLIQKESDLHDYVVSKLVYIEEAGARNQGGA